MSEHSTSTPFIKGSTQDQYGQIPLKSWTGKVVSFDSQKDQLESGWGWRYKVRIMGDNSDNDTVEEDDLSYAFCLLPTTAGSGGAYKLRSVRISQGDMVYGVYGGDSPRLILGVFPRTSKTSLSGGKFGTLSGFYGSLKNTGIISGEFNEQIGPQTPGLPNEINKSNRAISQREVQSIGVDPENPGPETNMSKKLTPPTTNETKVYEGNIDDNGRREPLGKKQFEYIIKNLSQDNLKEVIEQAELQKFVEPDVAKEMIKLIATGRGDEIYDLYNIGATPINENPGGSP